MDLDAPAAPTLSKPPVVEDPQPQLSDVSSCSQVPTVNGIYGDRRLHRSHRLFCQRGIVYCNACGYYVTAVPRKLIEPCSTAATGAGLDYLRRLRAGKPPKANMEWPLAESQGPEGIVRPV